MLLIGQFLFAEDGAINVTGKLLWGTSKPSKIADYAIDENGQVLLDYFIKEGNQLYNLRLNFNSPLRHLVVYLQKQNKQVTVFGKLDRVALGPEKGKILTRDDDGCKFIVTDTVLAVASFKPELVTKIEGQSKSGDGIIFHTKNRQYYIYLYSNDGQFIVETIQKAFKYKIPVKIQTDETQGEGFVIAAELVNN
jgi:hypothetical protein